MQIKYSICLINRAALNGNGARILVTVEAANAIEAQRIAVKNNGYLGFNEVESITMISAK